MTAAPDHHLFFFLFFFFFFPPFPTAIFFSVFLPPAFAAKRTGMRTLRRFDSPPSSPASLFSTLFPPSPARGLLAHRTRSGLPFSFPSSESCTLSPFFPPFRSKVAGRKVGAPSLFSSFFLFPLLPAPPFFCLSSPFPLSPVAGKDGGAPPSPFFSFPLVLAAIVNLLRVDVPISILFLPPLVFLSWLVVVGEGAWGTSFPFPSFFFFFFFGFFFFCRRKFRILFLYSLPLPFSGFLFSSFLSGVVDQQPETFPFSSSFFFPGFFFFLIHFFQA